MIFSSTSHMTITTALALTLPLLHSPSCTRTSRSRAIHFPTTSTSLKFSRYKTIYYHRSNALRQRQRSLIIMPSSISLQPATVKELTEEPNFHSLISLSSGLISICGFGSLLSSHTKISSHTFINVMFIDGNREKREEHFS